MIQPIIQVKDLKKQYKIGGVIIESLRGVTLDIYPGEYILLFGPSGCGKSTTLNLIAGLDEPTSGDVICNGLNINTISTTEKYAYHRDKIGMIFQSYNLVPTLNIVQNVELPQMANRVKPDLRRKKAMKLLKKFEVDMHARKTPLQLSGGQQQRVAIARSLVNNPNIILADEPTGNLDSKSAVFVMNVLRELNEVNKKTIILVTHNPEFISQPHRIIYMKDGAITSEVKNREIEWLVRKEQFLALPKTIQEIKQLYPSLAESQVKGKFLLYSLLRKHHIDDLSDGLMLRFENIIQDRITGILTPQDVLRLLDVSFEQGGIGLYRQIAQKIQKEIEEQIQVTHI